MIAHDLLAFFAPSPQALPLYAAFEQKLLTQHPDSKIKIQKTQITFSNRYGFAFVSLPRRKIKNRPDACMIVSFGLGSRVASPRIAEATEPYPNRWTHHVFVSDIRELDAELMGWIDAAYAFSARK